MGVGEGGGARQRGVGRMRAYPDDPDAGRWVAGSVDDDDDDDDDALSPWDGSAGLGRIRPAPEHSSAGVKPSKARPTSQGADTEDPSSCSWSVGLGPPSSFRRLSRKGVDAMKECL